MLLTEYRPFQVDKQLVEVSIRDNKPLIVSGVIQRAEVENQNGEMLGYKAVLECIKNNGHLSAEEIKQSLLDLGEVWLNGLQNQDDITIVVVKKLK